MAMPKAKLAATTLQNNNPVRPRKQKPYQVSYWLPDATARVPLLIEQFNAWSRDAAIQRVKVQFPTAIIRACYRAYGVKQIHNRGIDPATGQLHYNQEYPQRGRRCKCGCGVECAKWQRFATSECRRRVKNEKQLKTKRKRLRLARKAGRTLACHNCIKRNCRPGRKYCIHCKRYQ